MARAITTPPARVKRPRDGRRATLEPRYERGESRTELRRPRRLTVDAEPPLGPYEVRYRIDFGYSAPALG